MSQSVRPSAVVPTASAAVEVACHLDVDPARGVTSGEAASRLVTHGPNRLMAGNTSRAGAHAERRHQGCDAFLCQCEDIVQVILVVASFVNEVITGTQVVSVTEER
jgi:P-type Ca2+ transporter type 2C